MKNQRDGNVINNMCPGINTTTSMSEHPHPNLHGVWVQVLCQGGGRATVPQTGEGTAGYQTDKSYLKVPNMDLAKGFGTKTLWKGAAKSRSILIDTCTAYTQGPV